VPPSNELTIALSLGGSVVLAALPKILDFFFGEKIARRRDEVEAQKADRAEAAAYQLAVFQAAREDASALRRRITDLERLLGRSLDETNPGAKPPESKGA